jgi:enolase
VLCLLTMPSSTSWQRYDEEHNVSAILTKAARACVVENPRDVIDYFARYFREVAGGTAVKSLDCRAVMGSHAGPAMTFTLELCTGPEACITTSDATLVVFPDAKRSRKKSGEGKQEADDAGDEGDLGETYEQLFNTVRSSLVPQLCSLGSIEPQAAWDGILASMFEERSAAALSVQWALSVLASLAAAKQRRIALYQHFGTLIEAHAAHRIRGAASGIHSRATAAATSIGTVNAFSTNQKTTGVAAVATSAAGAGTHYAPPRLLVPFLINDTTQYSAEASGQVHFARVYVGLEPITCAATRSDDGGEEVVHHSDISGDAGSAVTVVDGTTLRRRTQQLRRAAQLFLSANPAAHAGEEGCVHWGGAGSFVEVVKAVTDALKAAALLPGVDVCLGLSLGAGDVRVRSSGCG